MICLERDGRKELGLGFVGGGGGDMEDTELEEGEACSYNTNNNNTNDDYDYDASVDPDIALSYIGEKLQDVLGHFQKDFEGGVSAENLGAKFGGYGSFLPAHQRSPVWSHPRTPQKIQQYNASRSPNNLQLEGGSRNSVSLSTAPQLALRMETGSTSGVSQPVMKASSSLIDPVKQEVCLSSNHFTEEVAPRYESVNKKSANLPDAKTLKVRIKVGSDNLSTQKNAAIYSGLGLDVSPSSSLDDSPSESEGMSHEPQDAPLDSPGDILRIMTSFPERGGLLLSPLSDDLIRLTEKEKPSKDSGSFPVPRVVENSRVIVSVSDPIKGDRKISGEKNTKVLERNDISTESKSENNKDFGSGIDVVPKEIDFDNLACEELVSNALKLPLLSNSSSALGEMGKGICRAPNVSKEVKKGVVRDRGFTDLTKEEQLMTTFTQEDCSIENTKATSAGKVWEDKKASSVDSVSVYPRKDGHRKGEKLYDSVKIESNVSIGLKGPISEPTDPAKEKIHQKATSHEQEGMKLPPGKESSSSEGKKKGKGNQGKVKAVAERPKESSRAGSSFTSKNKKGTSGDSHAMKGELEDLKSQKNTAKAGDRYRDFFGDIELEQEENRMSPSEINYGDRLKESDGIEKSTHVSNNMSRDRSSGKKVDKLSTSDAYSKAASIVPPLSGNELIPDAAPAAIVPVVALDDWVCCDKCEKWRLLPLGKNPADLPEKWHCGMLNWLPGKNRCSVSEEETTNALTALYQVPALDSLQSNLGGAISNIMLTDVRQPDQNGQTFGSHVLPTGGKKKHGSKDFSNTNYKYGTTTQLSNSTKKIREASVTNGSFNDVKRSPMTSEPDFHKLSKPSDTAVGKNKHKQKDKHKVLDNCSDGGDKMRSKMKGKRDSDQDLSKASKKIKTDGLSENWMSDHGGPTEKVGPSLCNGLLTASSGKNLPNYHERTSSKDSKLNRKDQVLVSAKNPKDKVSVSLDDGPVDKGKHNNRDVSKKRKMKGRNDSHTCTGSLSNSGNQLQDRNLVKEEFSENDYRKEKKARISRVEGKESSASKGIVRTDKKSSHRKSQHLGQDIVSQRSLDGVDSLKRDSGSLHPSAAATSSSSKVSGSHKSKANFHEAKGSPVESVSSSPLRVSKQEKFTSTRRNLTERDDSADPGIFMPGGLRRSSDGEDDGGSDRSGTERKEKTVGMVDHGTLEFSALEFEEKDLSHASGGKAKMQNLSSPDITDRRFTNGTADYLDQDTRYRSKTALDQCHDDVRQTDGHHHVNGSSAKKSGKESSSRSKDKIRKLYSESDNVVAKVSDSTNELAPSIEVKVVDTRKRLDEKVGVPAYENEKTKLDFGGLLLSENGKREGKSKTRDRGATDVKIDAIGQDATSTAKQSMPLECELVSGREKSLSLPSGGTQNDTNTQCPQPVTESYRGNGANGLAVNASGSDNSLKTQKTNKEVDHLNGILHSTSRNPTSSVHRVKDFDAPSPAKRDSTSQAANNAVKEAKNLKHMADRLKNSGSNLESTKLYFEAALKFLHGASLLETCGSENAKTGEMIQSMQTYSSTAELCKFCAHEYEKSKDMAGAALAYKCMEVAYMRVIYSLHTNANRDRNELQTALQMVPPGESPSSSASDIDNLNHPTTVDKVPLAKGISSPQVTGNHIIAARNRPNFDRLLNFARDVNYAMEASRKSRAAFAAANMSLGDAQHRESISSIKSALDFTFQDVEGLLRLVRLAIKAIGH